MSRHQPPVQSPYTQAVVYTIQQAHAPHTATVKKCLARQSGLSDSAHAHLPAGRKLQDTPDPAYFTKIQPRCTKSLAERQSHVFAPIELPAHQAVSETAAEHICLQMRWYPHSRLSRGRVMSFGFLCCNIAVSHNTCLPHLAVAVQTVSAAGREALNAHATT